MFRSFLVIAALLWSLPATAQMPAYGMGFHDPRTAPEKALARILDLDEKHYALFMKLTSGSPDYTPSIAKEYSGLFTTELLHAMETKQKSMVEDQCGGKYIEGEICGLDYSPISCTQDNGWPRVFRTEQESPRETIVSYTMPESYFPGPSYRLINNEGVWKLDGIDCGRAGLFNLSDKLLPVNPSSSPDK